MKTQLHLSKAKKIKPNFLVHISTSPNMHPSKEIIFLSATKIEYTAPVEINFYISQSFFFFFNFFFISLCQKPNTVSNTKIELKKKIRKSNQKTEQTIKTPPKKKKKKQYNCTVYRWFDEKGTNVSKEKYEY
jgi:hypothetical protein